MKPTAALLIACGIPSSAAERFEQPLTQACARFGIDTPRRLAAFIAQAAHESVMLTRMEELLSYSTPDRICKVFGERVTLTEAMRLVRNPRGLACHVYAGINGNGDRESGDGWAYRGRGIVQLTGRLRYREAGLALGVDYEGNPDLVAAPEHAALTAANYWSTNGCNRFADAWQIDAITRQVNGRRMLAARERRELSEQALRALSSKART